MVDGEDGSRDVEKMGEGGLVRVKIKKNSKGTCDRRGPPEGEGQKKLKNEPQQKRNRDAERMAARARWWKISILCLEGVT